MTSDEAVKPGPTGLEFLRSIIEGRNPMGTVHGGYLATLLDSALGSAVLTLLPAEQAYTTAQLSPSM